MTSRSFSGWELGPGALVAKRMPQPLRLKLERCSDSPAALWILIGSLVLRLLLLLILGCLLLHQILCLST